jgi:hypothetical protein
MDSHSSSEFLLNNSGKMAISSAHVRFSVDLMNRTSPSWDRSPGGAGTSAKMAALHAKGQLGLHQDFVHQSLLGSLFTGNLLEEVKAGPLSSGRSRDHRQGLDHWIRKLRSRLQRSIPRRLQDRRSMAREVLKQGFNIGPPAQGVVPASGGEVRQHLRCSSHRGHERKCRPANSNGDKPQPANDKSKPSSTTTL